MTKTVWSGIWKTCLVFSVSSFFPHRTILFPYQQMMLGWTLDKYSLECSHNCASLRKCLILLECWEKDGVSSFSTKQKCSKKRFQLCGMGKMRGEGWGGAGCSSLAFVPIFSLLQKSFHSTKLAADGPFF